MSNTIAKEPTARDSRGSGLESLSAAIDADGYEWLLSNAPTYVEAIERAVEAGKTPEFIRAYVAVRVGPDRQALALRCEQAARHIIWHKD